MPASLPILYSFRRCPYAMRARLAVKVSGVPVALREVVLRDKPAALIAASPKATVPVLVLPDGTVIDESLDIMRWALRQHDRAHWLDPLEADEVRLLIERNDSAFKQALDRYKYAPRHPQRTPTEWRDEALALLLPLNERLAQQRCLLRDTPSLADMAIVPFVRQFALVDAAWFAASPLQALREWMTCIISSALFDRVMPKFAPWRPGDEDIRF